MYCGWADLKPSSRIPVQFVRTHSFTQSRYTGSLSPWEPSTVVVSAASSSTTTSPAETAGSRTDVPAMAEGLNPAELTEARRDEGGIDRSSLSDGHPRDGGDGAGPELLHSAPAGSPRPLVMVKIREHTTIPVTIFHNKALLSGVAKRSHYSFNEYVSNVIFYV